MPDSDSPADGHRFDLGDATASLRRTPRVLDAWLRGLPAAWISAREGDGTWSPFDIVGHLLHGERTDWMPRARMILASGEAHVFDPVDRTAMLETSRGLTLGRLLDDFAAARADSLRQLAALRLTDRDLDRHGRHPQFGPVTLRQLLATWVAHDLDHLSQIARVLAHQYREDVGPWRAYLRIISGKPG